jgi:hypothetical protein
MTEVIVKKTHEVTSDEWQAITDGFNAEFEREKKAEELAAYYQCNFKGYSLHGIAKNEQGEIAGFSSILPYLYKEKSDETFTVGLSGSTFVKKEFRQDIFVFHDIYKALRRACVAEGYKVVLGVPNMNSYKYLVKLLGFKLLFHLPYYALPVKLHKLVKNRFIARFGFVWPVLSGMYVNLCSFVALFYNPAQDESEFTVSFTDEMFNLRFGQAYNKVYKGPYFFCYKMHEENGVNTAWLFQFSQNGKRTFKSLAKAVKHISTIEKPGVIIFVGSLHLKQPLLFRLPKKSEPKELPLTVDVLVEKSSSEYQKYSNAASWDFGLMNFDVR